MITLFIVWCLCRSAAMADRHAEELYKKGGTGKCTL